MATVITDAASRPQLIFLPCCGMAFLTVSTLFRLGAARYKAVTSRKVSPKYYRLYNTAGGEPEEVAQLAQHVENLFEAPPLFYLACVVLYLARGVSTTAAALAWAYFACRVVHTIVHTGSNNVNHRFLAYIASTLALTGLWGLATVAVLNA
jgi:hypothetical protein